MADPKTCTHLGDLYISTESGNIVTCFECGTEWIRIIRKESDGES